jgi:autotransporter-associated beta strand protein
MVVWVKREHAGVIGNTGENTGVTTLAKNDFGIWTLSGVNTYTGPTKVTAGALRLGGAASCNLERKLRCQFQLKKLTGSSTAR